MATIRNSKIYISAWIPKYEIIQGFPSILMIWLCLSGNPRRYKANYWQDTPFYKKYQELVILIFLFKGMGCWWKIYQNIIDMTNIYDVKQAWFRFYGASIVVILPVHFAIWIYDSVWWCTYFFICIIRQTKMCLKQFQWFSICCFLAILLILELLPLAYLIKDLMQQKINP